MDLGTADSSVNLSKIDYTALNSKQQEIFNFQKVAARLADYGFNCIKLADDWHGADFLAYHKDGEDTLKVQLKGRLLVNKAYLGKGLYMTFPLDGDWYLAPHDEIVAFLEAQTSYLDSSSWAERGVYHFPRPNQAVRDWLAPYRL